MKPTIGRIVHYHSYGTPGGEFKPLPRAAIVTAVNVGPPGDDDSVSLCAINPTGVFFNEHVRHAPDDKPTPGHWNWPPRE